MKYFETFSCFNLPPIFPRPQNGTLSRRKKSGVSSVTTSLVGIGKRPEQNMNDENTPRGLPRSATIVLRLVLKFCRFYKKRHTLIAYAARVSLRTPHISHSGFPRGEAGRFWCYDRLWFFQSTFGSFLSLRLQVEIKPSRHSTIGSERRRHEPVPQHHGRFRRCTYSPRANGCNPAGRGSSGQ